MSAAETVAEALASAAATESVVTAVKVDGRVFTGVVKLHPTEPDVYVLHTGSRGRPPVIHPDDVEEVVFE